MDEMSLAELMVLAQDKVRELGKLASALNNLNSFPGVSAKKRTGEQFRQVQLELNEAINEVAVRLLVD